jgi:hypothetical protein
MFDESIDAKAYPLHAFRGRRYKLTNIFLFYDLFDKTLLGQAV